MRYVSRLEEALMSLLLILLSIIVLYVMYTSGGYSSFYDFFVDKGVGIMIICYLGIVGSIYLFRIIIDIVIPAKKEVLFLEKTKGSRIDDRLVFIDKKGKIYKYINKDNIVYDSKYYEVLRYCFSVKEVLKESNKSFKLKPAKKNFWLTWYSPLGLLEDGLVLPIFYIFFAACVFSSVVSKGEMKVYGLALGALPLYFIIYDIVKKWKEW